MTKVSTISSLVRVASKGEPNFIEVAQNVLETESPERIADFFDKMNIPRSVGCDAVLAPVATFTVKKESIGDFAQERAISAGIQKYMDRHQRKIKWHAGHPSLEGSENVLLVMRCAMTVTTMRLDRLIYLLNSKDELTPVEWAYSREMMNRSYLSFRNFLDLLSGPWIDAVQMAVPREDLVEKLGNFYEFIDARVRTLEEYRVKIEERRAELTVSPVGYPPVKPPNYFGGDLLSRGPWKQFWNNIDNRAHTFREAIG